MNIKDIAEKAYDNAVRLGKIGDRTDIEKLKDLQSEYMEAFKALNNGNYAREEYLLQFPVVLDKNKKRFFEANVHNTYEDELTDCLFVVLTLMKDKKMDIELHINSKMIYNALRLPNSMP